MIKKNWVALGLSFAVCTFAANAQLIVPALSAAPMQAAFDLQEMPLSQVVGLYYKEVVNRPYVLCDEVIKDARLVSVRASGKSLDAAMLSVLLEAHGYEAREVQGVTVVCVAAKAVDMELGEPLIYRPMYRNASYLVDLLAPLVRGTFANKRMAAPALNVGGAPQKQIDASSAKPAEGSPLPMAHVIPAAVPAQKATQGDDYIIFNGTEREQQKLLKLLSRLDVVMGEVLVRGIVYEVSSASKSGSAFGLLTGLLGGKLNIGVGSTAGNLGNFIQLKNTALDAVYSMLETDNRFKVVASPSLRIQSGANGVFSVGQEVPVLGALSFPQGAGQAVQSVEYRSSGVIFDIQPTVRDVVIDMAINQQLSDFVKTTTGVNGSPTLTKRELRTTVGLQDGDVIVLGGLAEHKDAHTRDGLSFLPEFLQTKGRDASSTEILLVLQVQRL